MNFRDRQALEAIQLRGLTVESFGQAWRVYGPGVDILTASPANLSTFDIDRKGKAMNDETETPDPEESARLLMVAAARFAAAAMSIYNESYPDQAALLAQSGGAFGVRISEILSTSPRVALTNVIGGEEIEIAHVMLQQPAPLNPLAMH